MCFVVDGFLALGLRARYTLPAIFSGSFWVPMNTDRVDGTGEARPAGRDIAVAGPGRVGTYPEREQAASAKVEPKPHTLSCYGRQIGGILPSHRSYCAVR